MSKPPADQNPTEDLPFGQIDVSFNERSVEVTLDSNKSQSDTIEVSKQQLGNYEIIDEIARGGMGVVYRARQVNADRVVALKLIRGNDPGAQELERFEAEARAAAKLDHPNIVPIFDVGVIAGEPFFTMKLIEGLSLSQKLDGKPIDARLAARIVRDVAAGIAHAHQNEIVHRDLKPGNVLLDAGDTPLVTDFGLAKLSDEESDLTRTGQAIGTPAYMPPEQASGDRNKIDHRSDVYSLGALLYACLTGRPPFQGSSAMATVMAVMKDDPVSPRLLNADVTKDLETICLKCLEKDSTDRYQTALDFHDELTRFLSGEPIFARPVSTVERTLKWIRRNPLGTGLMAAMLIAAAGLTAAAVANSYSGRLAKSLDQANVQHALAVRSRNAAEELRGQAEQANKEVQQALEHLSKSEYHNKIQLAQMSFLNGDYAEASVRLTETTPSNRGWEFDYLTKQYLDNLNPTNAIPDSLYARKMAFTEDGKTLCSIYRSGEPHFQLQRWPLSEEKTIKFVLPADVRQNETERIGRVHYLDDHGERMIARTGSYGAYRNFLFESDWESDRIKSFQEIHFPSSCSIVAGNQDAGLAICRQWTSDRAPINSVGVIPLDQLRIQASQDAIVVKPKVWSCPGQMIRGVFSKDGRRLYVNAWDVLTSKRFFLVYDTESGAILNQRELEGDKPDEFQVSPDGTKIATSSGRRIKFFDSTTFELLQESERSASRIVMLHFLSGGETICLRTADNEIQVLDGNDLSRVLYQTRTASRIASIAEVPEGDFALVSRGGGQTLRMSYNDTFDRNRLKLHKGIVNSVAVSPDNRWIASCNDSRDADAGEIRISDFNDLGQSRVIPADDATLPSNIGWHINSINWLGFLPESDTLVTACYFRTVCFWDVQSGHLLKQIQLNGEPGLNSGAMSVDGQYAAFASYEGRAWLVDLKEMELVKTFLADDSLRAVWIDARARKLFSTSIESKSGDTILYTWSFDNDLPISARATGLDPVTTISQASHEDRLIVGMVDGMIGLIDPSASSKVDRSSLDMIQSGKATINAIIVSPTNDRCVTISDQGVMLLRDASTLRVVMPLAESEAGISSAAFSADGKVLVTGTKTGDLLIWDAGP